MGQVATWSIRGDNFNNFNHGDFIMKKERFYKVFFNGEWAAQGFMKLYQVKDLELHGFTVLNAI